MYVKSDSGDYSKVQQCAAAINNMLSTPNILDQFPGLKLIGLDLLHSCDVPLTMTPDVFETVETECGICPTPGDEYNPSDQMCCKS